MIFMFLVFWRPQEWLIPWLYGWPLLDLVVCVAMLSFQVEVKQGHVRIPRRKEYVWLLAGLWFAAVWSHVANTYFAGMISTIPDAFKPCFFAILLICVLDRPSRLRAIAWLFVVMACIMSVHALLQQTRLYGFAGQMPIIGRAPGEFRSLFFGIFEDPNDLAQILATSIPFTFALFRRRTVLGLALGCAITWLLVEAIMATGSRGGQIALAAVSSVMVALMLPARWLLFLLMAMLAGALLLCPLSAGLLDPSARDRIVFWGMANQAFKVHPLFGVGYGMFGEVAGDRASHNAFVSCYTTLGFFGYWFWFGLMQLSIVGAWRTWVAFGRSRNVEDAWLKRFAGLCIAAMAGYCASAYFLSRDFVYPIFFLFALLGSVAVVGEERLPAGHGSLFGSQQSILIMITVGAVVSIFYIYFSILMLNKAYGG